MLDWHPSRGLVDSQMRRNLILQKGSLFVYDKIINDEGLALGSILSHVEHKQVT